MGPRWLTVWHDFSEVPFWAIGDRKTVSLEVLHGPMVVNCIRVPLDMTNSKKEKKVY